MIIDSPSVIDLALGVDRRIPEDGDAQLLLPAVVTPVVPMMLPTREQTVGNNVQQSMIFSSTRLNNNQAASADTLAILPPGLYELDLAIFAAGDFNQGIALADIGVRITLDFGSSAIVLIMVFITATGPFQFKRRVQVLMPVQSSLIHRVMITTAIQNIQSTSSVNVVRII